MLTKAEIEAALAKIARFNLSHLELEKLSAKALHDLLAAREDAEALLVLVRELWVYGTLRPVDGVVYPSGTHREVLDRALAALAAHEALGGGEGTT